MPSSGKKRANAGRGSAKKKQKAVEYVAEKIVGARKKNDGSWEYKIRWAGYAPSDDTWEPKACLNDALYRTALVFRRELEKNTSNSCDATTTADNEFSTVNNELDDRSTGNDDETDGASEEDAPSEEDSLSEEESAVSVEISSEEEIQDHWKWNDDEQMQYKEIERINVNDPDARHRVTDARLNGTPVCLIGHKGWPQFASRWLKLKGEESHSSTSAPSPPVAATTTASNETTQSEQSISTPDAQSESSQKENRQESPLAAKKLPPSIVTAASVDDWLDLTKDWEIDVDKMAKDVGDERVKVLRKKYNESDPLKDTLLVKNFLKNHWPSKSNDSREKTRKSKGDLYLHQWQYPKDASADAKNKLCYPGNYKPLPNNILGEDLLQYYEDREVCNGDNPNQYLFMGRQDTNSKLHSDPGGLAITIAPVVGKKEVVLVHRADGNSCLYGLNASLDKIDLHKYPMLCHARVYKSTIHPGEILLMPQGTFHQCRNVSPCLSYSRFHLDSVNLRPFFESMINMDSFDIQHEDIIWNAASSLHEWIDAQTEEAKPSQEQMDVPPEVIRKVDALRSLRNISREIVKRYHEGTLDVNRQPPGCGTAEDSSGPGIDIEANENENQVTNEEQMNHWINLLCDIDKSLHNFRYRHHEVKPQWKPRASKRRLKEKPMSEAKLGLKSLPGVTDFTPCRAESITVTVNDKVEVNWQSHRVQGVIKKIEVAMSAAWVTYEDLDDADSEWLPFDCLRMPVNGECNAEVPREDVVPGRVLVNQYGRQVCWNVFPTLYDRCRAFLVVVNSHPQFCAPRNTGAQSAQRKNLLFFCSASMLAKRVSNAGCREAQCLPFKHRRLEVGKHI